MMTRLTVLCAGLIFAFALLMISMRMVGSFNPTPAILMIEPGDCDQPCWQGIQPGRTAFEQLSDHLKVANSRLVELRSSSDSTELCWRIAAAPDKMIWRGCAHRRWSNDPAVPIFSLDLEPPLKTLRLGDLMVLLGDPIGSKLCRAARIPSSAVPNPYVVGHVYFRDHIYATVYRAVEPNVKRFDPDMVVTWMLYYSDTDPLNDPYIPRWRGFITPTDLQGCAM